jgi:bacterioferritin (cytochrome b1)
MNAERANIIVARNAGDEVTAEIFAELLKGSEASVSDIEATKKQIEQIGLDNYLANKV